MMHQEVVSQSDLLRALTSHNKFTKGTFQSTSSLLAMLALLFVVGGQELPKELWVNRGAELVMWTWQLQTPRRRLLPWKCEKSLDTDRMHGIMAVICPGWVLCRCPLQGLMHVSAALKNKDVAECPLSALSVVPVTAAGCPAVGRAGVLAASSGLKMMSVQSPSLSGLQGAAEHKAFTQFP